MNKLVFISIALIINGCASSGVIPMDKGTFMINKRSAQAGFGPPLGAKGDVYQEANTYCAKENKQVETIKFEMVNSGFARPGSVSLQFRCVNANTTKALNRNLKIPLAITTTL